MDGDGKKEGCYCDGDAAGFVAPPSVPSYVKFAPDSATLCEMPCHLMRNGPTRNQWVSREPLPPHAKFDNMLSNFA